MLDGDKRPEISARDFYALCRAGYDPQRIQDAHIGLLRRHPGLIGWATVVSYLTSRDERQEGCMEAILRQGLPAGTDLGQDRWAAGRSILENLDQELPAEPSLRRS